jgi:methyl-accepting chemotaxis protein
MSDVNNPDATEYLRLIWNEMKVLSQQSRATNARLDQTNERLDQTNKQLDQVKEELSARIDQTNERLDQTNERLDRTNARLDRVVQDQIHMANAFLRMEGAIERLDQNQRKTTEVVEGLLREVQSLNGRLDHVLVGPMGQQVRDHEERLSRVEKHLGLTSSS